MNKRWVACMSALSCLQTWATPTAVAVDSLQVKSAPSSGAHPIPAMRECTIFNELPRLRDMREPPPGGHPGHVHQPPSQKPPATQKIRLPIEIQTVATANSDLAIEMRIGRMALLAALGRHHQLTIEKLRVEVFRFTGENSQLGYPPLGGLGALTLLPHEHQAPVLILSGSIAASRPPTNRWAFVAVATSAKHEFESPQIRCYLTATPSR